MPGRSVHSNLLAAMRAYGLVSTNTVMVVCMRQPVAMLRMRYHTSGNKKPSDKGNAKKVAVSYETKKPGLATR